MTPSEFLELEEMEQMQTIFDHAIELAVREDAEHRHHLYQLFSFYVEEIWHKELKVRRVVKTFTSTNSVMLKPYLDRIDIKGL